MNGWMYGLMDRWMDGYIIDGWVNEKWIFGLVEGWVEGVVAE